jgi:hypothetical protein
VNQKKKGNNMKFTKTLAISLLTLGAMQFAMAETVKIDLNLSKQPETKMISPNHLFKIGDILELSFIDTAGSVGGEPITVEASEAYLLRGEEKSIDKGTVHKRVIPFTVIDISDETPIKLTQGNEILSTIQITTAKPAIYSIDFSGVDSGTRDLTNIAGGTGKLNFGDLIKIQLPAYQGGTYYSYDVTYPEKILDKVAEYNLKHDTRELTGKNKVPVYVFEVKNQHKKSRDIIAIKSVGSAGTERSYEVKFAINNLLRS